jgi:hypothetical protein
MNTNYVLNNFENGTVLYGRVSIFITSFIITLLYYHFSKDGNKGDNKGDNKDGKKSDNKIFYVLVLSLLSMLWIFAFLTLFYKKAAILSAIIHFGTPL